jgi:hypothetical protein
MLKTTQSRGLYVIGKVKDQTTDVVIPDISFDYNNRQQGHRFSESLLSINTMKINFI